LLPYEARLFARILSGNGNEGAATTTTTNGNNNSSSVNSGGWSSIIGILTVRCLGPFSPRAFASHLPHSIEHLFVANELFADATQQESLTTLPQCLPTIVPCHQHSSTTSTSTSNNNNHNDSILPTTTNGDHNNNHHHHQPPPTPIQHATSALERALSQIHHTSSTLSLPPASSLLCRVVIFGTTLNASTCNHVNHQPISLLTSVLSSSLYLRVAQYDSFKNDTLKTEISFTPISSLVPHFDPWGDVDLLIFTSSNHPESSHEQAEMVKQLLKSSPSAKVIYNCQKTKPSEDLLHAVHAKGAKLLCFDFDAYLKKAVGISHYTRQDVQALAEILVIHLLDASFVSKEQALRHFYPQINPLIAKETGSSEKSLNKYLLTPPQVGNNHNNMSTTSMFNGSTINTTRDLIPSRGNTPVGFLGGNGTGTGSNHSNNRHSSSYRPRLGYIEPSHHDVPTTSSSSTTTTTTTNSLNDQTSSSGESYERLLQNLFRDKKDYIMLSTSSNTLETCFGILAARTSSTTMTTTSNTLPQSSFGKGWILVEPNTDSVGDISSGVHHIVSHHHTSNSISTATTTNGHHNHNATTGDPLNIKVVLCISPTPKDNPSILLRQLGLYAMNYGNSYVASICVEENHAHAVKALLEADQFQGPAIILACTLKDSKWPLYRWNPHASHLQQYGYGHAQKFNLDSVSLQQDVSEFLRHDQQLTLIAKQTPDFSDELNSLEHAAKVKQQELKKHYKHLAEALLESNGKGKAGGQDGQASKPDLQLLVLYGSDSGKGASVASRIAEKIEKAGYGETRCMEANEYPLDTLDEEKHVILVFSTAGQGEDCANAKKFCKAITDRTSNFPKSLKFAVFGLGDSSYWGAGTVDSARYFCAPSKRMFDKFKKLQATPLVSTCYCGDDRHDDGFETQLALFEKAVYEALNVLGLSQASEQAHVDDDIKIDSNYLRGTIKEGLEDLSTGKLVFEDTKITKFHGIYQQDDRDLRDKLDNDGKERAYSFMIRIGVPGGIATAEQYLMMDDLCTQYANGRLKVTTRQAYQFHGVIKKNLKTTMQGINRACLNTLAACGDVNRNIIANPQIGDGPVFEHVSELARALDKHLKPKTGAYHEIWLDKKPVFSHVNSVSGLMNTGHNAHNVSDPIEPMYGRTYLPRKFKIAIAVPPRNDVDVFAHCVGFIAIVDPTNNSNNLLGYNITVGGGLGTTHGDKKTYPRLADVMGFVRTQEQCIKVVEAILTVQRDYGERLNRKHARLKYTVEDHGIDWYRSQVEERIGFKLELAKPFKFETNSDRFGWHLAKNGQSWSFGMFVENGLIFDDGWNGIQNVNTNLSSLNVPGGNSQRVFKQKSALRELATLLLDGGLVSLTSNQNVMLSNIPLNKKPLVQGILEKYRLVEVASVGGSVSAMRLHSMACVALPTCALAFAESQRYLPFLIDKIDVILERNGLKGEPITIRMTGCPNGCARPYVAEIALVGKAPGVYNLHLGGGHAGNRLNRIYKEGVHEGEILEILGNLFSRYAKERHQGERFGDFVCRIGIVMPVHHGHSFWAQTREENDVSGGTGTIQLYW
jgi:sulfite reductase beta subunit-like hemoprotein/flavodoxin